MNNIDWWNVLFTIAFAVLTVFGYTLVLQNGGTPRYISIADALVLALAAFRLTRFTVYDSIMQWFRDLVSAGQPRTFVGTIRTLVNCAWCTGLWFALVVSTVFFAWPQFWFFLFVLALGGVASVIQILANLIGWNAEFKKRATVGVPGTPQNPTGSGTCG